MAERYEVYLRPLHETDATTSWKWRNNPALWRYTGSRPDREVTEEMERAWAKKVFVDPRRMNFAICRTSDNAYIGNIYLVDIHDLRGELGIFIGDVSAHGHGYGRQALELLKKEAKSKGLAEIFIDVDKDNVPALVSYLKCGAVVNAMIGSRLKLLIHLG